MSTGFAVLSAFAIDGQCLLEVSGNMGKYVHCLLDGGLFF
jgi:hypothetical protein